LKAPTVHRAILLLALVAPAGACAAAIPADVPIQRDYRAQLVELFQTRLLAQSRIAGTNYEAAGRQLARLTAQSMADEQIDQKALPMPLVDQSELAALADALREIGCDDPAILFCCMRAYTRCWREQDARRIAPLLTRITNRQLPALIVYFLNNELAAASNERTEYDRINRARTAALFATVSATREQWLVNPAQLRLALALVEEDEIRYDHLPVGSRLRDEAAKLANAHPWVVAMLKGRSEMAVARRNSSDAAAMRQHATTAKAYFEQAAKLQPMSPEASAGLIEVAAALGEPVMPAIERALYTEVDNGGIWDAVEAALKPPAGGNYNAWLGAAELAADTNRYDSLAPLRYVRVVESMMNDWIRDHGGGPVKSSDKAAVERALEILQHYIDVEPGTDRSRHFVARKANDAWRVFQWETIA
jgi:hypothetical protein